MRCSEPLLRANRVHLHRKKQRAFSPIGKALVLLLLLGSDRQSRQLIEQRLGLFQIERIEAFGEPA